MKRDQLNDTYLEFVEKQRLYFKTVKDFQEVLYLVYFYCILLFRQFTKVTKLPT